MSRPVRIELPNALDHVTARSDRREDIVVDDVDRQGFVDTLAQVVEKIATHFGLHFTTVGGIVRGDG